MQSLKNFFLICSGVNRTLLRRAPSEVNKYVGIGATIFFTGVFAALAAGYALYSVFHQVIPAVAIAIFWGLLIFNLDRFIVSTMKKKGSKMQDFTSALPRLVLAVLIALVIAKPLELKIFESEIKTELVKMEQEQFKLQDELVLNRFSPRTDSLKSEIALLKSEINEKQKERDALVSIALAEADGTGGSMNKNLGPIYKTKKAAADKVQLELDQLVAVNTLEMNSKQNEINTLNNAQKSTLGDLERIPLNGFAAQLEGLERAADRSHAIWLANIFIMLLFIAIETAPVVTKMILERGPYDYLLDKHETQFQVNHQRFTEPEQYAAQQHNKFEIETTEYRTKLSILAEKELADEAIKRRVEELKGRTNVGGGFIQHSSLMGS